MFDFIKMCFTKCLESQKGVMLGIIQWFRAFMGRRSLSARDQVVSICKGWFVVVHGTRWLFIGIPMKRRRLKLVFTVLFCHKQSRQNFDSWFNSHERSHIEPRSPRATGMGGPCNPKNRWISPRSSPGSDLSKMAKLCCSRTSLFGLGHFN